MHIAFIKFNPSHLHLEQCSHDSLLYDRHPHRAVHRNLDSPLASNPLQRGERERGPAGRALRNGNRAVSRVPSRPGSSTKDVRAGGNAGPLVQRIAANERLLQRGCGVRYDHVDAIERRSHRIFPPQGFGGGADLLSETGLAFGKGSRSAHTLVSNKRAVDKEPVLSTRFLRRWGTRRADCRTFREATAGHHQRPLAMVRCAFTRRPPA